MFVPKLLIFDLDGTLVDSQVDLANSINATLTHYGKPELPLKTIATYIGDGAATLVRRALAHSHLIHDQPDPHDDELIYQATHWFIAYYHVHKLDFTTLYPGVLHALTMIRERHPALPMAVLTNKPVNPSRAICRHFGLDRFFFQNYGGNSFSRKKPDPEGILRLISEASTAMGAPIKPAETVMIGDSHVDVETARAGGTKALGCAYGLSPKSLEEAKPDFSVSSAFEWVDVLGL